MRGFLFIKFYPTYLKNIPISAIFTDNFNQMNVEIVEKVVTTTLDIELSIDNLTTNFFNSLSDFRASIEMDNVIEPDSMIKDVFILTIKNYKQNQDDYSVAIDKRRIPEYIDNFINTLERREEYEVCRAFLNLKNKYKNLKNEE